MPTLIQVVDGVEIERTVGWPRDQWEALTGVTGLGEDLPVMRPGCGSMSVDPDLVDTLRVRFGATMLRSRRIEIAELEDEFELMFQPRLDRRPAGRAADRGTRAADADGHPARARRDRRRRAARPRRRHRREGRDHRGDGGLPPEYLPWVLTAVEAACTDEFNMHGVLATTMPVGPVIVCNGPVRARSG